MHRGTSYLSIARDDDGNVRRPANGVLRGAGCLILGAAALFLLSPAPHARPGAVAVVGGASILRDADPMSSVRRAAVADPRERARRLPARVRSLLAQSRIVGDRLGEVKEGRATVEEIVLGGAARPGGDGPDGGAGAGGVGGRVGPGSASRSHKSAPMTLGEVTESLRSFLKRLDSSNAKNKRATFHGIWAAYHDLAAKWLYPWDREYLRRMPPRREDGSVFLSVVSFRDEFCVKTLEGAFGKARHPEKLFVGLVQQNCEDDRCRSGVLEGGKMEDVDPDPDCYVLFCSSAAGRKYCDDGHVRLLRMKESESLGPYMARYFASKLWMGEQWYMQIDAHMNFLQDWDALSIGMLEAAPSEKPVVSHYPPAHTADLEAKAGDGDPAPRLCGPAFATSDLEGQIVRLEGSYDYDDARLETPRFAPFVAAGYLVAHSGVLREVPFDPFLPYVFMGEEIHLSARLWTSGYDIFSPTRSLLGHHYVRSHKPKFWESVHRTFTFGIHNPLQMLVLNRIKYQLGYPEAARDMIKPKSLFTAVEQYSMGTSRSLEDYLKIVGLDMNLKEVTYTAWCETGVPPPGFEKYRHLY